MPSLPLPAPKAKKTKKQKTSASTDIEPTNDALFAKLFASAEQVAEMHTHNAQKPALSDHEHSVNQFVAYLTTQLKQVKQEVWFDFTMAAQNLVHQYIVKGNNAGVVIARPVPQTSPPQPDNYQQQHAPVSYPVSGGGSATFTPLQPVTYTHSNSYGIQNQSYMSGGGADTLVFNVPSSPAPGYNSIYNPPLPLLK